MGRPRLVPVLQAGTWAAVCLGCHLLCGPVRWPASCSHGQGRGASRSRLHRVGLFCFPKQPKCTTYSQGAEKYIPLPPSGRKGKFILQRAEVEGQNWGHMCPQPHPWRLGGGNVFHCPPCLQEVWESRPPPPLPPQASWPCSKSTQQAAHNFRENLSHVRCFLFDSQKLCKGIVFSRNASLHRLRSQLRFPFLISSEIPRCPLCNGGNSSRPFLILDGFGPFQAETEGRSSPPWSHLGPLWPWLHPPATPAPSPPGGTRAAWSPSWPCTIPD